MAEVVWRLTQGEDEDTHQDTGSESLWEIAGIAEDPGLAIEGVPVSEDPELYLTDSHSGRRE